VSWNRNAVENPSKGVEKYLYNGKELQEETAAKCTIPMEIIVIQGMLGVMAMRWD
jgi:hypothetical protein